MYSGASSYRNVVAEAIDAEKVSLHQLSDTIWLHPELCYQEHHAHDTLTDYLEDQGFKVERSYHFSTAFRAEYVNNAGDDEVVVCIMCEYDALPEIGHACGHNLMAEVGVAAALGVKAAMKSGNIGGKLVVLGTPAEEGGGGKVALIKRGAFKDIHFALIAHPTNVDILEISTLAIVSIVVRYFGKEVDATVNPWDGRNALDAAMECYNNVSFCRQKMKPTWRVHGIISKGGVAPTKIPDQTELMYIVRAPTIEELSEFQNMVVDCFEAAAKSTGCRMEYEIEENSNYDNILLNHSLLEVYRQFAEEENVCFIPDSGLASTDVGNVSHVIPCIQPTFAIPCKSKNHTKEFAVAAGSVASQMPTLRAARLLAMTALEIFLSPKLRETANKEFSENCNRIVSL